MQKIAHVGKRRTPMEISNMKKEIKKGYVYSINIRKKGGNS